LDEEDVGVVRLENCVDVGVASVCIDGLYFELVYCHILGIHPCGGFGGDHVSGGCGRLGVGGLWAISNGVHVLFKWALVIYYEVTCPSLPYIYIVEALYWAIT
jgi:hypothetical protein